MSYASEEVVVQKKNEAQGVLQAILQYVHSILVGSDNTIESSVKEEYAGALTPLVVSCLEAHFF